ncbi:unnamed protein product [Rhizoctonia solani]|uniref:tRNA(Ile)-lysidine synthetase n=1 Tax=Rhizoctonia solani TaxID=456999 RepID=A0A8H3HG02_9AGAM|nr:unnamed protein product [Rhizoctonia solani]
MSAITLAEFTHLLSACRPPSGWGKSITVALSGGPDSICLLSLLQRARLGVSLRSITIDHSLQPTSRDSALRTRARSEAIGVPGVVLPADWNGAKPRPGEAVEEVARDARYRALWRGLQAGEGTIMFGHHADDQLETVIMRVLRGTGTYGLGGMRAVRRWGWVGDRGQEITGPSCANDLRADHPLRGMRTFISRPLLPIPKERILATCHAHKLEYEQDVTNFMPDLTVRNAVRHALSRADRPTHGAISPNEIRGSIPTDRIHDPTFMDKIQTAINHVHTLAGGKGTPDLNLMRAYVGKMSARVRQVDQLGTYYTTLPAFSNLCAVTDYLQTHIRPSPPSTLLLVPPPHQMEKDTTHALVLRILRYVSPHPWGTPESEAHRRRTSIERIAQRVLHEQEKQVSFCAGAQVLWSPVWVRPDGRIRTRRAGEESCGRTKGWLASRQPPTTSLERKVHPGESIVWDNRFFVRVPDSPDLVVRPHGRFVLPQLVRSERVVDDCGVEFIRELSAI